MKKRIFIIALICQLLTITIVNNFDISAYNSGWNLENNSWVYYENNKKVTGWKYINGSWYYMNSNGIMQKNWLSLGGKWYYLGNDGAMKTGWLQENSDWYYLNESGEMQIGWRIIDNIKYLFDASGKMVQGGRYYVIDVSEWQDNINWTVLKQNSIDGVILRVSHGLKVDTKFKSYLAEIKKLNISYGIYHYNTADNTVDALKQADFMLKILSDNNANPSLPVFTDIESNAGKCDLNAIAKVYCSEFIKKGYLPGIYANTNYWNNYLTDKSLNAYYKWIANYGTKANNSNATASSTFKPKDSISNYMMWQYTSQNKMNGILSTYVDSNVMFEWYLKNDGWKQIDNKWYYYSNGGHLNNGWVQVNNHWYYTNGSGEMQTGWIYVNNHWYYTNGSGEMQTGWIYVNNQWYYMDESGALK